MPTQEDKARLIEQIQTLPTTVSLATLAINIDQLASYDTATSKKQSSLRKYLLDMVKKDYSKAQK